MDIVLVFSLFFLSRYLPFVPRIFNSAKLLTIFVKISMLNFWHDPKYASGAVTDPTDLLKITSVSDFT